MEEVEDNWAKFDDDNVKEQTKEPENVTFFQLFFRHFLQTVTYFAVFLCFGMCVAFLGPTILDLGCLTSSDMEETSWVFMAQLLFSLIGAMMAAFLVQRIAPEKIIFLNTLFLPTCMVFVPFSTSIYTLAFILAVMGFNMGLIDSISNQQMLNIYRGSVAPFLHALHFCYGIGAFISPMIAEPYLLNEDCSIFIDNISSIDKNDNELSSAIKFAHSKAGIVEVNSSSFPASTLKEAQAMTHVKYAFWIMALIQCPVILLSFINMRNKTKNFSDETVRPLDQQEGKPMSSHDERIPFASYKTQIFFITVASGMLLFIFDGLQSSYAGYIYSYAVKSITKLKKTEGAYLNATFWGMFAFGRLISIFLATQLTSSFMLFTSIMGCVLSSSFMLILQHKRSILYIGTIVFGLSLSSIAPSTISMAEKYIEITASRTSFLVVIAATGEMICPVIVGNIFVKLGPLSFLAFICLMCFVSLFIYCSIWIVGKTTPKHKASCATSSFIWRYKPFMLNKEDKNPTNLQTVKYAPEEKTPGTFVALELNNLT